MCSENHLGNLDAALIAFQVQFERELGRRWEDLASRAKTAILDALPENQFAGLSQFFNDIEQEIAKVVHKHLPKLLRAAKAHRTHIKPQSPLFWTETQILSQACKFLSIDQEIDPNTDPRADSRVLTTVAGIMTDTGCRPEEPISAFLLPWWVKANVSLLSRHFKPFSGEPFETLSRADTLAWVRDKELGIWSRLQQQVRDEAFEGVLAAGQGDVSVLEAEYVNAQPLPHPTNLGAADASRADASTAVAPPGSIDTNGSRNERSLFVQPLLDKKGWSVLDWAVHSSVDFHTANDYLKGKTKPYKSTRTKLAKSLHVTVGKLPK